MTYTVSKRKRPGFSSLFDEFLTKDFLNLSNEGVGSRAVNPAVNIKETEKDFQLEVSAAGMNKEDFKLELDNNMLTVSAERKNEGNTNDEKGKYTRREFSYSSFSRSFTLPDNKVNEEAVNASYADGILHITLPKMEDEPIPEKKKLISVA
jgi:HSP20 family protein